MAPRSTVRALCAIGPWTNAESVHVGLHEVRGRHSQQPHVHEKASEQITLAAQGQSVPEEASKISQPLTRSLAVPHHGSIQNPWHS